MKNRRKVCEGKYIVISHTHIPKAFSVFLQGDALKEVVAQMREGEDLAITVSNETNTEFEIIDTHNRYESEPPRPAASCGGKGGASPRDDD
jgi:hypothetical protein